MISQSSESEDQPQAESTQAQFPQPRGRIKAIAAGGNAVSRKQPAWQRQLRYVYYRFIRLRSRPHAIARGLAVGVFAGFFPLFGLQTIIGIALAIVFRGNKIVAAAGTWVSNPFTYLPIYAFNLWIGRLILQVDLDFDDLLNRRLQSWPDLLQTGNVFVATLFLGCAVVGGIAAVIAYFLGLWLAQMVHQRRQLQRHHRLERRQSLQSSRVDAPNVDSPSIDSTDPE